VLAREEQRLRRLTSLHGLQRWRDALVQANSLQDGSYGCALGSALLTFPWAPFHDR
jgi:TetR/AcrR family transcriptional regulator, transcriptional repressor for nem operon